ncbi:hypothetical protein [Azospirillum doebereinerae]
MFSVGMLSWKKGIHDTAYCYLERAASHPESSAEMGFRFCIFLRERSRFIDLAAAADRFLERGQVTGTEEVVAMKVFAHAYLGSAFYNVFGWDEALRHYEKSASHATPARLPRSIAENIAKGLMASASSLGILEGRLAEVNRRLVDAYGDVVVGGFFAGLMLPPGEDTAAPCQRIGSYETELAPVLERAIAERAYRHVINIGSSWGYYTVGLARRLPHSTTVAYELDPTVLATARRTARLNGVEERVRFLGGCDTGNIHEAFPRDHGALVMIDCEGCEMELLDPDLVPALKGCDILVECHDFVDAQITPTLLRRFAATHEVQRIDKQVKLPFDFASLEKLSVLDRWFAVAEPRSETTWWLWLRTRQDARGF